jgi:hypothetical protein
MKKNGQEYLDVLTSQDARTGWKSPSNNKEISRACDAWLQKNCPPKKKRRFGNY